MSDMIVIGAGAAGMMAAYRGAQNGHNVILLEKNEKLGKKIYITGKGRCNVTNAGDMEQLLGNVVSNPKFLYSAFYGFDNTQLMALIEANGCRLKVERGDRVFPVSDHSSDIIAALKRALEKAGVDIRLHTEVKKLLITEESQIQGVMLTDGSSINADMVVVATGGLSYPTTGSTGDGYRFATECGHNITECVPALVPFEIKEDWCKELQGLALKNVSILLSCGKKKIYEGFGEMLFTHFGVSGPLILSASSYYASKCKKQKKEEPWSLTLDLKPALSKEQLDKRLLRDFDENKNKQFKNAITDLFPSRLVPVMIELSGISPEQKIHEITKEQRQAFVELIKAVPLTITGTRGFSEAIITMGGVSVKEINPATMESKLVSGLYFAGEVLDLDALTGGYNLQIAWSTGYLAGDR